jgi:predicted transcriptional regulator
MIGHPDIRLRKKIYDTIAINPGIYLSKLTEIFNLPIAQIESHLIYMENRKLIIMARDEGNIRYYINDDKDGLQNKRILKTKRKIYDCIADNPGLYLSKIAEMLQMSVPLVDYHMSRLENESLIIVVKEDGFKRYYTKVDTMGLQDKKILSILRQEIPLKIVLFLLKHPNAKHKDICENLDLSSSLISYYLNKLVNQEIIDVPGVGEGFKIRNKQEIVTILRRYHLSSILKRFTDTWEDIT